MLLNIDVTKQAQVIVSQRAMNINRSTAYLNKLSFHKKL